MSEEQAAGGRRQAESFEERRRRFIEGLHQLVNETGLLVGGCGGCGCCASRECPALMVVPAHGKLERVELDDSGRLSYFVREGNVLREISWSE